MDVEITLRDLSIVLDKDGTRDSFPVMHASLSYRVGAPPTVQVTISAASLFNATTAEEKSFRELFEDSPDGTVGTLVLTLSIGDQEHTLYLFSGYVSGLGSNLTTSILTVQSNITFQLVATLMGINALPGGVFKVFDNTAGQGILYKPYEIYLMGRAAGSKIPDKLKKLFLENPADCILKLIDHLRNNSVNISGLSIADCFDATHIKFKLKTKPANGTVVDLFAAKLAKALVGAPAASVAMSVFRELFLTPIPQTLVNYAEYADGSIASMSGMIVRPSVSGWEKQAKIELKASDILGMSDTTQFRLDQRVDFWFVVRGVGSIHSAQKYAAVYAPGYGEGGEAVFWNTAELKKRVDATAAPSARSLIGRMVMLPWWAEQILVNDPGDSNAGTPAQSANKDKPAIPVSGALRPPAKANTDSSEWDDMCKRMAVLSFLENGCAVNTLALKLPFAIMLKLLPWLGDTISVTTPAPADTVSTANLYEIPGTEKYGLLDGVSMTFELSQKELHVTCGATLSQVHDKAMHEKLAAENPLYVSDPNRCYNRDALQMVEELFDNVDRSRA